ncbi:hypothetical protein GRS82_03270 [Rathayibacter iranicus NCPPB 2253 = VKM Ac-1602]|nr:hypothetical protein [Rathayibacter iranicus NCPPB 2253 = VKM Ac-1602]
MTPPPHNHLVSATPAADSTVTEQPSELVLTTNDNLLVLASDGAAAASRVVGPDGGYYRTAASASSGRRRRCRSSLESGRLRGDLAGRLDRRASRVGAVHLRLGARRPRRPGRGCGGGARLQRHRCSRPGSRRCRRAPRWEVRAGCRGLPSSTV